jgi:hypothetical protein
MHRPSDRLATAHTTITEDNREEQIRTRAYDCTKHADANTGMTRKIGFELKPRSPGRQSEQLRSVGKK